MTLALRTVLVAAAAGAIAGADPTPRLSVDHLPARLDREVAWRPGTAGIEYGELQLSGAGEAWRTRVVVVRLDPRRVSLSLEPAFAEEERWTVADAGAPAALARQRGAVPRIVALGLGRDRRAAAPLAGVCAAGRRGGGGPLGRRAHRAARWCRGRAAARRGARGVPELSHAAGERRAAGGAGADRAGSGRGPPGCQTRARHVAGWARRRGADAIRRARSPARGLPLDSPRRRWRG